MGYLIFLFVLATVLITITVVRSRPDDDPVRTVADFRRAVKALDPNAGRRRRS